MIVPLLAVLLQVYGPQPKATAADTMYVRAMLDSAAASIHMLERDYDGARTFIEQLHLWRDDDAAWAAARRLDERKHSADHYYTRLVLATALRAGNRDRVRGYLSAFPTATRDSIIRSLPNFMGRIPAAMVSLLDSLSRSPESRAERLFHQAVALRQDHNPTAARETLHRAIAVLRSSGVELYPLAWAIEQLRLGEHVPVGWLVTLGAREAGDNGRLREASAVDRVRNYLPTLEPALASRIADSLMQRLPRDTALYVVMLRAGLLRLRAEPGDSAAAARLYDTIAVRSPSPFGASVINYELQNEFLVAFQGRDSAFVEQVLAKWRKTDGSADALRGVANASAGNDDQHWATWALWRLWREVGTMQPAGRDSVRTRLLEILRVINPIVALDSARTGISLQPARDRARSDILRYLVNVDAQRAEQEARTLEDASARDDAYRVLTNAAIAGGRLQEAQRFADAISNGSVAWVSSQLAITQRLAKVSSRADLTRRIRDILPRMNAVPECSGCIVVNGNVGTPRHHRKEIVDALSLALQHDMHSEVQAWAAGQNSAEARVWAWLQIVQAVSFLKLGQYPNIPMHGR